MEKFYKERFRFQERLITKIAPSTELSQIIEAARDELRAVISDAVEVCIFLLDPEAVHYTRPIQCVLHQRPYSCQACKPDRRAVHRAVDRKKAVVITKSDPIFRHGHPQVKVGPEYAVPIMVKEEVFGVVSVVTRPGANYNRADFFFIRDLARLLSGIVLNAKKQWQETLEKIKISKALSHMAPFVPVSIRDIAGRNPEMLNMKKQRKEVTVLFLDIEGYTRLSETVRDDEMNDIIERLFSSFVDPIHRAKGIINEIAGDGLMIIFGSHEPGTNAMNAVKAGFEIAERARAVNWFLNETVPIYVNVGINSGNALVGMTTFKGSLNTRMTYTASGSVTNIAARLSDYAQGGDILIGKNTKELIQDLWPTFYKGKIKIKGIENPLEVFSLLK